MVPWATREQVQGGRCVSCRLEARCGIWGDWDSKVLRGSRLGPVCVRPVPRASLLRTG